jgi:hypothetical protein
MGQIVTHLPEIGYPNVVFEQFTASKQDLVKLSANSPPVHAFEHNFVLKSA